MSDAPFLIRLVAASVAIADKAGLIVRDIMKKGELGIVEKTGIQDLQTQADRTVQMSISTSISRLFPGVNVLGEEDDDQPAVDEQYVYSDMSADVLKYADKCPDKYKNVKPEQVVVWIDPLDGTKEYTEGLLDHVTVLIGIAIDGQSAAGVIHQPYFNYKAGEGAQLGRTIWGIIGVGSFGFTQKKLPEGKTIITTTRSHPTKTVQEAIDAFKPDEVIRVGGCGHKVLIVLEGEAHVYLFASPGCKKWDTCGPQAILEAIGGRLTDIHGNVLQYHKDVKKPNTGGVLATICNHDYFLKNIPQGIKDQLKP
ncbi:3'(2'),5'-bisphosphate nucleotidase 1-like [Ptychodera flava]|uniref:3'(2'),5'-bisphosphate nucleotidase 1-like n=1 Tax=Ptychodera flava TaxID=63121 RepID=UPI00396A58FE